MIRRAVVLLGLIGSARLAHAQPAAGVARVGVLSGLNSAEGMQFFAPFRQRLAELGHVEGRNLQIDFRFADGQLDRLPALAAELLAMRPDVLTGVAPGARAAAAATKSVPVVALAVDDPVAMGLAQTMARPGGNVTGVSSWGIELLAKRLQLLGELAPGVRRVGVLGSTSSGLQRSDAFVEFERRLGIAIVIGTASGAAEFDAVFAQFAREGVGGLVVVAIRWST